MSLWQKCFGSRVKLIQRSADKYIWEIVWDDRSIREYHEARKKVRDVELLGYDRSVLGYGDSYKEASEAWEYDDGSILLCATIAEWGGTFASHDDIRVNYYILTPK